MLKKYPLQVKVVYKHFPLRNHRHAAPAAVASMAAYRQGKFWEFHDELYKNYRSLSSQKFEEIAKQLGLDMEQFHSDLKDPELNAKIQTDFQEGIQLGIRGVPAVFVNGKQIKNRSFQGFQEMIEAELQKAN